MFAIRGGPDAGRLKKKEQMSFVTTVESRDPNDCRVSFYELEKEEKTITSLTRLAADLFSVQHSKLLFSALGCSWLQEAGITEFRRASIPGFELPVQEEQVIYLRVSAGSGNGSESCYLHFCGVQLVSPDGLILGYLLVPDGKVKHLEHQIAALLQVRAQLFACIEILRESFRMQRDLHQQQEYITCQRQYQKLFESGRELDIIFDRTGKIQYVNRVVSRMLNYSPQSLVGMNIRDLPFWADDTLIDSTMQPLILNERERAAFDCLVITRRKEQKWISWVVATEGSHWLMSGRDITEGMTSELQFSKLWVAENLDQGVCILDEDGRVLWTNRAFSRLTGFKAHEIVGRHHHDLLLGEQSSKNTWNWISVQTDAGKPSTTELKIYHKAGNDFWVSLHTSVVTDPNGDKRIIQVYSDINEKKEKELELEALSLATRKSSTGFGVQDSDGKILWINKAIEEMLGYTIDELRNLDPRSIFPGPNTDFRTLGRILNTPPERSYEIEIELYTKDRSPRWFHISKNPVLSRTKKVERTIFHLIDITSRKKSELKLRKLSSVATHSPNAILFMDLRGKITWVNAAFEQIFGYTYEEVLESGISLTVGPETKPREFDRVFRLVRGGGNGKTEQTLYHKDGSCRHVIATANPVFAANRRTTAIALSLTDITDERQKDQEIKKLSLIAAESPNGIMLQDKDGRVTWINQAFESITGYTVNDLNGQGRHPAFTDTKASRRFYDSILAPGKNGKQNSAELLLTTKDGAEKWSRVVMFPIRNSSGKLDSTVTLVTDITDRKQAERELNMLSLVASKTVIGVAITDHRRKTQWINPAFEKITGYGIDDVVGKRSGNVLKGPDTDREELARVRRLSREKQSYYTELLVYKKDGTPFWMAASGTPVFNDGGQLVQEIEIIDDISERKFAELQLIRTREEALRLSRAKEAFLSVMSHEIRTPLHSVVGITQLLLEANPTDEQLEYLNLLKFSGDNLNVLINDILDFTKIETGNLVLEKTPFNLADLVKKTIASLQVKAEENHTRLVLSMAPAVPQTIMGDPVRLFQILMNLVGNAIKFTRDGQVELKLRLLAEKRDSVRISFEVADTGIGIPADKLEKIFEPYAQASEDTARNFGGTGLGLAIVKNLLKIHGSTIRVDSKPGTGSSFSFEIEFAKPRLQTEERPGTLAGLRILVVDDQDINLRIAGKVLDSLEAITDFAESGAIALEKIKGRTYDCILMDIHMPGMNGTEAAATIRSYTQPYFQNLPIIALTGSTDEQDLKLIAASGMNGQITKPFTAGHLLEII